MEKLKSIGSVLITIGVASYLLSLVNLQIKIMGIFGSYKIYVEIGCIVMGLLFYVITKLFGKSEHKEENN